MSTQRGTILVTALLYLSVISLLVVSALEVSFLETKMSNYFYDEAYAFQNAESALTAGEASVTLDQNEGEGASGADGHYRFIKMSNSECDLEYFQVYAFGTHLNAKVNLESVMAVPKHSEDCQAQPPVVRHRVSWHEVV